MATQESHNRRPHYDELSVGVADVSQLLAALGDTLDGSDQDLTNLGALGATSATVSSAPSADADVARHAEVSAKADAPHDHAAHGTITATRDLQPEGAQTGLTADAPGVQYAGQVHQRVDVGLLAGDRAAYIEAATASSAGDEEVTVELYDPDAAAVVGSVTITGGSARSRSADLSDGLTAGNDVYVRWDVTTASGTTDATFDALAVRLVVE
jgi:hypothetical protein